MDFRDCRAGAVFLFMVLAATASAFGDDRPIVPKGFVVDVVAREPMVSNPCVLAFDERGRLCVAQGPQWRAPTPETPGDRVDFLLDDDGDGIADRRRTFADGFNSIQGIAWHGKDLWVANAPDLTVVRDTDGDDVADQYIRVYTDLGNLEHSLHGLNFGPDGRLYMSKGNSKGYNRPGRTAPSAFRELWGLESPEGTPDYTPLEITDRAGYQRAYHTPNDDWGRQGGILRCDPYHEGKVYGRNLEIVAQGFRNPWDITFDGGFNWLGTDNDQTQGDRLFMPFPGAHFGWGHTWSFHWTGEGHLPTIPVSAPLYEGSGAGLICYQGTQFPEEYRGVFFVNDWMRREVSIFRPEWDGALMKSAGGVPPVFAHAGGGRSLAAGSGRVFEPTDIEVGPDGCLYVLSWGHGYGSTVQDGQQLDAGRVYRIRYQATAIGGESKAYRSDPYSDWTLLQLYEDLGSSVPVCRVNAQNELMQRREFVAAVQASVEGLTDELSLRLESPSQARSTWLLWAAGRVLLEDRHVDEMFAAIIRRPETTLNARLQSIRILADRSRRRLDEGGTVDVAAADWLLPLLSHGEARVRHEAVQAVSRMRLTEVVPALVERAAAETDRVTWYSVWNALRELTTAEFRKSLLEDSRPGVQLASLLGLFENDEADVEDVLAFRTSPDARVAELVEMWLLKTGAAEPLVTLLPPPGEYTEPITVTLRSSLSRARLNYTTDGSVPSNTSPVYQGPIAVSQTTRLRVAVTQELLQAGRIVDAEYLIRPQQAYRHRVFITDVQTRVPGRLEIDWTGIAVGKFHYTDRSYTITDVPPPLRGLPFLRTYNGHDRQEGDEFLSFRSDSDLRVLVGVDARNKAPLNWMRVGASDGFRDTGLRLGTTDPEFRIYEKHFPAGRIVLGGNVNNARTDSGRGNYIVLFDRTLLKNPSGAEATRSEVLVALGTADPERGRELFLHPKGAGCVKCHRMEGLGVAFAPDLATIGTRAPRADIIMDAILDPGAVITEGYAVQQVIMTSGKLVSGAVLEETARSMKLVNAEAEVTEVQKADIEERIGTRLSPMPSGFGKLLTAQQIADLVVWLQAQTVVGDTAGFSFRDRKDRLEIHLGKQRIATYLKQHEKLTRRALVNVTSPRGIPLTRNFPPRKPEDLDPGYAAEEGIIHPLMHPGIWMSFGDVNGNDYWRLQAEVKFSGFVERPYGDRDGGGFGVRNLFLREGAGAMPNTSDDSSVRSAEGSDGAVVCEEVTHYVFRRVPEGVALRVTAEYRSDEHDFYFGDQEESGLAVRISSPLRVQGGAGAIVNEQGDRNGAEVWGKESRWFDYFGLVDGREVGVMVLSDPRNPRPSWLHARDYGVVVTNPFPRQPKERREPYIKTWIRKGESLRLSYVILLHDLSPGSRLDREAVAKRLEAMFER